MAHWITGALGLIVAALGAAVLLLLQRLRRSHQKSAEQELKCSLLLDYMVEGVLVLDSPFTVLFHTQSAAPLVTFAKGQLLFTPLGPEYEAILEDHAPLTRDRWPSVRAFHGETIRNELLILRHKATGDFIYRNVTAVPFVSPIDRKLRVLAIIRDDTQHHRIDEARSHLAAIVESCDDAIISTDTAGVVTSWNRGAERMYGYTAVEMLGTDLRCLKPESGVEAEWPHIPRLIRGETVDPFNTVRIAKDGRRVDVALSTFAVRNTAGEIIGTSGIARDITATRALERQLIQSQKMEAIGQLTGGIAHDFNNLLAIILGNLELLEHTISTDNPAIRRAHTAQRAAARCADLTKRLLAFSSREHLSPTATRLEHSIRNTLDMATHALGPDIEVTLTSEPGLPPVFIDPSGFESALLNLVVNARDAMPRGGRLDLSIRNVSLGPADALVLNGSLKPSSYALICVVDHGHGMPQNVLDRVFEPFYTTKERGRGTGLGLPMVYGFARQSGGTVTIESEPGLGATVRLYFPFASMPSAPIDRPAAPATDPLPGATILMVDDEADLLDVACDYLTAIGYRILRAENAVQALRAAATEDVIDLIITDILMPGGVNGVELVQNIADIRPAIKILFTSGFPASEFEQRGVILPDYTLLRKPYRLAELRDAIRRVLTETPAAPTS